MLLLSKGKIHEHLHKISARMKDLSFSAEETHELPREGANFDAVFIVDYNTPKNGLGKNVKKMKFKETVAKKMKIAAAPAATEAAAAPAAIEAAAAPADAAASAAAATAPASAGDQKRPASPANTSPVTKKARVLKMLVSEEANDAEDQEASTLETLLQKINAAAMADAIYSDDKANADTVHFWSMQALDSLKQSASTEGIGNGTPQGTADGQLDSQPRTRRSMFKEHFAKFLLKKLYSLKCFNQLKHFMPIFDELKKVGCQMPANLNGLKTFASNDTNDPAAASAHDFTDGDMADRLRFLDSALYKDWLEHRTENMICGAQLAENQEKRDGFLNALANTAKLNTRQPTPLDTKARWTRSLFTRGLADVDRVLFAMEEDSKERVAFACLFKNIQDRVPWKTLEFFVNTTSSMPDHVTVETFRDAVELVEQAGVRKFLVNPAVAAFCDCKAELTLALGSPAPNWLEEFLTATVRGKLSVTHWPDHFMNFDTSGIQDHHVCAVARYVTKFLVKGPQWILTLKERVVALKSQPIAKGGKKRAAGESLAADNKRPKPDEPETPERETGEDDTQTAAAAAAAAGSAAAGAAAATAEAAGAAAAGAAAAAENFKGFFVGDQVRLDSTVPKKYIGEMANVNKVTAKTVTVDIMEGTNMVFKTFRHTQCTVVTPSTSRPTSAPEPASAAAAPASAAPVPAPEDLAGSAAQAPGSVPPTQDSALRTVLSTNDKDLTASVFVEFPDQTNTQSCT